MQTVKNALGMTEETTPGVMNMEDNNLMMDGMSQSPELTAIKDTKEGDGTKEDDEFLESSSSNIGGKETTDTRVHGTDDEDSNDEDSDEDDVEDKLTDLVGENNMSNLHKPCKRPGDMVMIVPCPEHEVDLMANRGFFVMDMNSIGKMTETELKDYIRNLSET